MLEKAVMRKAKSLPLDLFYDNYALYWDLRDTTFKGRINLPTYRAQSLELQLHAFQVICDLSVKLGNYLQSKPPVLDVRSNIEFRKSYKDCLGYLDDKSSNDNFKTNEVAFALSQAAKKRSKITFDDSIVIDGCDGFEVLRYDELHLMFALTSKFTFNGASEYNTKHRLSPHAITRFVQRYGDYKRDGNAIDQLTSFLKGNNFRITPKGSSKTLFDCICEESGYGVVLRKFNESPSIHRFIVLTFKHDYYDSSYVDSYLDDDVEKEINTVFNIPLS